MSEDINTLELKISKFLRAGVILAGLIMLVGWIMRFKWHGNVFVNFETYDRLPFSFLIQRHFELKHWGVLIEYAGLMVLISLPIIRVFLTAYLFIRQKEFYLAWIAITVLIGLFLSMYLGFEL